MESTAVVAIVSVCATTLVALLPVYIDWRKSERERIAAEKKRIYKVAAKLLRDLANFRYTKDEEIAKAAGVLAPQAFAELRASQGAWEVVIFPRLKNSEREEVAKMRKEEFGRKNIAKNVMSLTDKVVSYTHTAIDRVK